jgi:hypothetical protein
MISATIAAWTLGAHLLSFHAPGAYTSDAGRRVAYERVTPGLYLRAPSGLTFGAYRNSYGDGSAYAGWTFETEDKRFALTVAGVAGYKRAAVLPMVIPSVRFSLTDDDKMALRIAGAPRIEKGGAALLHVAVEAPF